MIINPLGWVQLKLFGGMRRMVVLATFYAGLILMLHILLYYAMKAVEPSDPLLRLVNITYNFMLVVMAAVLLLGGPVAIKNAIQRDFTTDMISSHRLTAMSGQTTALGYLTGCLSQIITLTIVNWLICTILALLSGISVVVPSLALVYLVGLTGLFCTFGLLLALCTRGKVSIAAVVVILAIVSRTPAVDYFPGLSLLFGAFLFQDFPWKTPGPQVVGLLAAALVAQAAFAATFFLAASRRTWRDDVPAFTPQLGFILLALSALLTAVGQRFLPPSAFWMIGGSGLKTATQLIVGLTAVALVAMLPVAAAARQSAIWAKRKALDPDWAERRPRHWVLLAVVAGGTALGIMTVVLTPLLAEAYPVPLDPQPPQEGDGPRALIVEYSPVAFLATCGGWIAAFLILPLVALGGLLRVAYATSTKALWLVVSFIVMIWAMPPLVDLIIGNVTARQASEPLSALMAISPIGAWTIILRLADGPLAPALTFHSVLAAGSLLLATRAKY